MRVRFSLRAEKDLSRILRYIEERSPLGSLNVGRTIQNTIAMIGAHPDVGRSASRGTRVLPVGRYPYLVYWRREGRDVTIVHIRHAARQPLRA